MKRNKLLFTLMLVGMACVFMAGGLQAGTQVADVIKLQNPAYEKHTKGIVEFTHKKHSTDYGAACGDCLVVEYRTDAGTHRLLVDGGLVAAKMKTLKMLGDPYTDDQIAGAADAVEGKTEMEALIAYLQKMGTDIRAEATR